MQVYWDLTGKACTGICRGPLGATARVVVVEAAPPQLCSRKTKHLYCSVHVVLLFLLVLLVV